MTLTESHRNGHATGDASLREAVLVQASALAESMGRADRPIVLAVRPNSEDSWYDAPRIPGAVDVFLDTDLAAPSDRRAGSRPLPALASLEARARAWGLKQLSDVVLYDHEGGLQAARGWWVLRWAGIARVRLLDGGYGAWRGAGLPVEFKPPCPATGDVTLAAGGMLELDATSAARLARNGLLLDSRVRPNYEGGVSGPGEPARGHIPGAVSAPAPANLNAAGFFLSPAELRALYAAAGVDGIKPVGVYCGAGVSAAHDILALASIGVEAPMYVGSWSAWSSDPSRPVARGTDPG